MIDEQVLRFSISVMLYVLNQTCVCVSQKRDKVYSYVNILIT